MFVCLKLLSKGLTMRRLRPIIFELSQVSGPDAYEFDELSNLLFIGSAKC